MNRDISRTNIRCLFFDGVYLLFGSGICRFELVICQFGSGICRFGLIICQFSYLSIRTSFASLPKSKNPPQNRGGFLHYIKTPSSLFGKSVPLFHLVKCRQYPFPRYQS